MHVASIAGAARDFPPAAVPARPALPVREVVLHRLRTEADLQKVLFLREEIDLSVHAAAGPQFALLEKKETSAGSCAASNTPASGSARSASSRWVTA